jgi:putative hydrolase of the HAD superfamily
MSLPKYLVLDLDNTLYPKSSGLDEAMRLRILSYLVVRHGLTEKQASDARERYVKMYGLSLPGIMNDFDVDVVDYQEYIHDVDVKAYVKPNAVLNDILKSCPIEKVIYTNSSLPHVERVFSALGISKGMFSHIVDYRATGCIAKPQMESFASMLEIIHASGEECIMVDDMPKTVCVAKNQFGMKGILVDEDGRGGCQEADWIIKDINEIKRVLSSIYDIEN